MSSNDIDERTDGRIAAGNWPTTSGAGGGKKEEKKEQQQMERRKSRNKSREKGEGKEKLFAIVLCRLSIEKSLSEKVI